VLPSTRNTNVIGSSSLGGKVVTSGWVGIEHFGVL
jgi:hypothetical protein